jgi:hypothetical protein
MVVAHARVIVVSVHSAYQVRPREDLVVLAERSHLHEVRKEGGTVDSMLSPSAVMMVVATMWTYSSRLSCGTSTSHSGRCLGVKQFFAILGLVRRSGYLGGLST